MIEKGNGEQEESTGYQWLEETLQEAIWSYNPAYGSDDLIAKAKHAIVKHIEKLKTTQSLFIRYDEIYNETLLGLIEREYFNPPYVKGWHITTLIKLSDNKWLVKWESNLIPITNHVN